jgi:DNA-binding NarL/FixJ family response regulator
MAMRTVRVMVVDDQAMFRRAIARSIDVIDGFTLVGAVSSGEQAIALLDVMDVDLALVDVHMPGLGGLRTTRHIVDAHPDVTVVLVSTYDACDVPEDISASGVAYREKQGLGPDELVRLWKARGGARPQ